MVLGLESVATVVCYLCSGTGCLVVVDVMSGVVL